MLFLTILTTPIPTDTPDLLHADYRDVHNTSHSTCRVKTIGRIFLQANPGSESMQLQLESQQLLVVRTFPYWLAFVPVSASSCLALSMSYLTLPCHAFPSLVLPLPCLPSATFALRSA